MDEEYVLKVVHDPQRELDDIMFLTSQDSDGPENVAEIEEDDEE